MRISVITACYNRERTIARAIESVLAQTYPGVEYIVVDGASRDGTMAVVGSYGPRISKVLSEPDGGLYEAINKGIRMATGEVIGVMHSDDEFYSPEVLRAVAHVFETTGAQIVYGDGIFVNENQPGKVVRNWISGPYSKKKVRNGWLPLHPTVYVRREVFDSAGLYDESYRIAADTDWQVRILYDHDFKVEYLHKYVVRMNMGGLSTSWKTQRKKWAEDLRLYRAHGFNSYLALAKKVLSKVKQF